MTDKAAVDLPDDIDTLKSMYLERDSACDEKSKLIETKDKRIAHLEQIVHYLKLKQFGSSSERYVPPEQDSLFNEAEQLDEQADHEQQDTPTASTTDSNEVKPRKRGRCKFPDTLPRHKVYHDLDPDQKQCSCGCELHVIDEVTSEQLGIIPAEIYVIQHCRKKYSCPKCQEKAPVTAALPAQPLPKSNASAELLAHIATSKFLDGLPFYRQEQILSRIDIHLPRATMANWMIGSGKLVQPLINLFSEYQNQGPVMHIDETPTQVLKEPDKPATGKKYFWVTVGGPPDKPIYRYHYNPSRGSAVAQDLLEGFRGTVMSDDWHIYGKVCEKLQQTHINCNDHARRKFKAAFDGLPKKKKKSGTSKPEMALNFYRKLYSIERRIKDLTAEQKYEIRQKESVPVWDAFITWMEKHLNNVAPETTLGKALNYTYKLKEKLRYYCEDGNLPISNEKAENAVRPFAIARKNFLFFDSARGADASANLYSLIITAKQQGLNPFYYLAYVFKCLPLASTIEDVEALLPWNINPEELKQCVPIVNMDVD